MKTTLNIGFGALLLFIMSCDTRTYEDISDPVVTPQVVTYTQNIKPILENNCLACHVPNGAASHYPLTDYNLAKAAIDNILDRIQRPAGDPSKMPQGGSLPQTTIEIIKKWKTDGLPE